ncbi:MAG: L-seryl-tRNA(Sec) selenium transferase [Candidatus Eremiobacteraeota bacterium]|nr:L-seryl-tRNA(Sec) selenium transferase [Candidatus Eremiobacteraeota bacterium]
MSETMRGLPAVHRFLSDPKIAAFESALGRESVKDAVSVVLDRARAMRQEVPPFERLRDEALASLHFKRLQTLVPVINGTGVLLHTSLGRAPLSYEALEAIAQVGHGYSNLEFDLVEGERASRYGRVSELLRTLTGAEESLVVNNCAAAVLLILDTFAKGREVVVARNELVEIGGGFRVPDVLARSGARLVEVGTTNKTYAEDFARAVTTQTAMLLRTHPSNYRITGFTHEPSHAELAALAQRAGLLAAEDLGSGALLDLKEFGLPHERTVQEAVADGMHLVAFSGDKLLGGPQCGIIVGTRAHVSRLRNNALLRALRVDKATLAALAATLASYASGRARELVPIYRMLSASHQQLRERAARYVAALNGARIIEAKGSVGGGSLPGIEFSSVAVEFSSSAPQEIAQRLRISRPALVPYIQSDRLCVDVRTILPEQDQAAIRALHEAFA